MTKLTHVRVKPGVIDEELGYDMGGWSGRVTAQDGNLLTIEWDGPTLRRIPDATLRNCIDKGYSYEEYYLEITDVDPAAPIDTLAETASTLKELEDRYYDYNMYQGATFPFATYPNFSSADALPRNNEGWRAYLDESLVFPFEARYMEGYFLKHKAKATLTGLGELTERYGIFVEGHMAGRNQIAVPLADFEGVDAQKESTKQLEWYRVWFANR